VKTPTVWQDKQGKLHAVKCGCNTHGKARFDEEERGATFLDTFSRCLYCGFAFYYTTHRAKKAGAK
jgi:hypothetical protein